MEKCLGKQENRKGKESDEKSSRDEKSDFFSTFSLRSRRERKQKKREKASESKSKRERKKSTEKKSTVCHPSFSVIFLNMLKITYYLAQGYTFTLSYVCVCVHVFDFIKFKQPLIFQVN